MTELEKEMLKALEIAGRFVGNLSMTKRGEQVYKRISAAIAKAKGQS